MGLYKQKIKSLVFNGSYYLKVYHLFKPFYSGVGTILMFHRLVNDKKNDRIKSVAELEVTVDFFNELIGYLKGLRYDFISLDDIEERLKVPKSKRHFVCFTFDDGYRDNYTLAYPLLKRHNIPFAVYITTDFPDKKAVLWWYMLEDLVINNNSVSFEYKGKKHNYRFDSYSQKEKVFDCLKYLFLTSTTSESEGLQKALFHSFGIYAKDYINNLGIDWSEIKEMSKDMLVTIGAHTVSHSMLTELSDEKIHSEIKDSAKIIESNIKQKVYHFAYPYGSKIAVSEREIGLAKKHHFKTCVTTRVANVFSEHAKYLEALPRLIVDGSHQNLSWIKVFMSGLPSAMIHKLKRVVVD